MIRILFLLLIVTCAQAFAQTEEQPKAVLIDEFERATNGYVKMKMDYFYTELNNNPSSQGVIISYGTDREIAIRERQIRVSIQWRKYDASRITMVNGGFRDEVKSEFWIVPPGAENPVPKSNARLFDEFGKFNDENLWARIDNLYVELGNNPDLQGYITLAGSTKTVSASERRFKDYIALKKFDASRVIFKKAVLAKELKIQFWLVSEEKTKKGKTEIWIVPAGAKPPVK